MTLDEVRRSKHHGLPPFLAELLVFGLFAAVGAAATKYSDESAKVLAAVVAQIKQLEAKLAASK